MNEGATAIERLAAFASSSFAEIPDPVRAAGTSAIVNAVSLAVEAAHHAAVEAVLSLVATFAHGDAAHVLGRAERLDPMWAAFAGGTAVHVEDFDDTHVRAMIHASAPVVPVAFAVGEELGASGREVLEAVVAGCETAIRVGLGMAPDLYDRGWHVTGVLGHIGAAVAAGRLRGLDAATLAHAMALAAMQAAGLTASHGTMTKSFHAGKAAADGLEAVDFARSGVRGPLDVLEAPHGLGAALAGHFDEGPVFDGLGTRWELLENAFKPYACGVLGHAVIDAALALRDAVAGEREIERVAYRVPPAALVKMGIRDPQDSLQAKFSVYHCAAVAILDGGAGPPQFADARARDPQVAALRARIDAEVDERLPKDAVTVEAILSGGRRWSHRVEHATGSAGNPMTPAKLRKKAELLVAPRLGAAPGRALLDALFALDGVSDVRPIVEACAAGSYARADRGGTNAVTGGAGPA